ncbi:hypothetical protein GWK41_10025 [Persephonella atlantica]|uniref:Uncharacterized protein n=1 Tax=Persephonella atlantica TaxID=2699429 RepID=A0ABS1GKG7_9AQUI|nr:hypothetical protein [Persephonella atlantica]MBK3333401.1 hypothetical protein [Persephonella atlantica]
MSKQLNLFNNLREAETTIEDTKKAVKIIEDIILPNLKELVEDFSELQEDIEYFENLLRKL